MTYNTTYDPDGDILCIDFRPGSYEHGGAEDAGEDVVLHYDAEGRLAEIEVYRVSEKESLPGEAEAQVA